MLQIISKRKDKKLEEKIAALEAHIKTLENDLMHDALTSLKTRKAFEHEARLNIQTVLESHEAVQRREWFGFKNLSFVFFDVDNFKEINDTYGHATGDQVLKRVANTIMGLVRERDTAGRWGGEEIVLMLVGAREEDARKKAEGIREAVESLKFDTPDLKITISAGIATVDPQIKTQDIFHETIARADKAMYKAKASGRNCVVTWSEV